ncbi:MAG TPA: hypothetical protein VLG76_02685 [Rhabdochlamydiaceae bacterium]|nr:hypothetical protein [Rhabdochlamydiaceae bacterium]
MSVNKINSHEPIYYHREYTNDLKKSKNDQVEKTWVDDAQRFALVALPFISLYKPLSLPLSLATGGLRVFSCTSQLLASIQKGDRKEIAYQSTQTAIAILALAGTVFAHPLGMLITTAHDILIELSHLLTNLKEGKYEAAVLNCANIVNNALYFSLFVHGGLEIAIASLAVQVIIGGYHSYDEFKQGHHLEAAGHLLMGIIRSNQLRVQYTFQSHLKLKSIANEVLNTVCSINVTQRYETYSVFQTVINGFTFHVADYIDGTRVVTCLDGPDRGLQIVGVPGLIQTYSNVVQWNIDHFIHYYEHGRIISYVNRQIAELY